ncbi:YdcF family protein, partial [Vibrio sp. 10N.222.55.E8]
MTKQSPTQSSLDKPSTVMLHRAVDTLWNFMSMGHKVEPSDCIFVLCSN